MIFEPDPAGLEELLKGPEAAAYLNQAGRELAREWQRNDPRRHAPEITVTEDHTTDGLAVVVGAEHDSFWHLIEFGSVNNEPYRPATKAAHNVGIELKDERA